MTKFLSPYLKRTKEYVDRIMARSGRPQIEDSLLILFLSLIVKETNQMVDSFSGSVKLKNQIPGSVNQIT